MPPPITATLRDAPVIVTSSQLCRRCQPLNKGLSCGGSAYLGAADEVDKAVAGGLSRLIAQALRPGVERIGGIAVGLIIGAAPQMGIDEIRGDLEVGAGGVADERHLLAGGLVVDGSRPRLPPA